MERFANRDVSHRLSTLVNAHAILVMQQGKLVDKGYVYKLLNNRSQGHRLPR